MRVLGRRKDPHRIDRSLLVVIRSLWLRLFVAVAGIAYVAMVGIGWAETAVHGDYGVRDASPARDGMEITVLAGEGAASRAGLRPGDVILQLDGTPASNPDDYWRTVVKPRRRAGEHATLVVLRTLPDLVTADSEAPQQVDLTLDSGLAVPGEVYRAISYSLVGLLFLVSVSAVALARPAEPAARVLLIAGVSASLAVVTAILGSLVEDVWIGFVEVNSFLDDALTILVERYAALIVDARHPHVARLHFEHVVLAIPVRIDPFADRIAGKQRFLFFPRPITSVGINATSL